MVIFKHLLEYLSTTCRKRKAKMANCRERRVGGRGRGDRGGERTNGGVSRPACPDRIHRVFVPKSIVCLREGYTRESLTRDVSAGVVVGIVALPLALAFAIASGVPPARGLYTAI